MFLVLVLKVASCYRKKDHGINLTQIGVVNFLRYRPSLKIECCKNLKMCKGGLTFVEVLEETAVLVYFEKLESRFEDITKSTFHLQPEPSPESFMFQFGGD